MAELRVGFRILGISDADLTRFMAKVEVRPNGCWLWTASKRPNGYGQFGLGKPSRPVYAHRFSYAAHRGPIPDGLDLDHLCRTRECVNPHHLQAVTRRENLLRSALTIPGREIRQKHCIAGHPLDGDNLVYAADGRSRGCRACIRRRKREAYYRKKAAA